MPPLRVHHVSVQFAGLGGVESVLRDHHRNDAGQGLDSRFTVFWGAAVPGWERVAFLDLDPGRPVRVARARFASAHPGFEPDVTVFHTPWGWPYFADLDPAPLRALYLHSDTPGLDGHLASRSRWCDGLLAVSDVLMDRCRRQAPHLGEGRLHRVHYPIDPPAGLPVPVPRSSEAPLRLGYCGRLEREQKRVERFVDLVGLLDAAGVAYELEFLGEGPERSWLEERMRDRSRVRFLGRLQGADYWRVLAGWDAMVFVSDYEGTPIALIEGLAAGVLPVHPRIGSGGDAYAAAVDPSLVYPPGDLAALAGVVGRLAGRPGAEWVPLRGRAREVAAPHAAARYREGFAGFLRRLAEMPSAGRSPLPGRPFPVDHLSFTALERLARWRRWMRG